jgi:hypothetical protein
MGRALIWIILAVLWAAIALAGLLHHHAGNATLEGVVALLFLLVGVAVRRRDRRWGKASAGLG